MTEDNQALVAEQLEQAEKAESNVDHSPVLYKFTNAKESPHLDSLLAMFYQGCYDNRIGIMEAHNLITEEVEMILVGVEADQDGKPVCFPLCRLLRAEDVPNYLSPDGEGGFFDLMDPSESAAARENMKSITEATVE